MSDMTTETFAAHVKQHRMEVNKALIEIPAMCSTCGKVFSNKNNLASHIRGKVLQ